MFLAARVIDNPFNDSIQPLTLMSRDENKFGTSIGTARQQSCLCTKQSRTLKIAWGGSSSQGGMAKVFTMSGGRMRVVQEIDWDTYFDAGQPTHSFDPSTNTLVIRSAHYIPGDAHCCVSAMDAVTFGGMALALSRSVSRPSSPGTAKCKAKRYSGSLSEQ
jgi:hypothetical protein